MWDLTRKTLKATSTPRNTTRQCRYQTITSMIFFLSYHGLPVEHGKLCYAFGLVLLKWIDLSGFFKTFYWDQLTNIHENGWNERLKVSGFSGIFVHQWMHEKKVPVTTNGGALFETQEQSVREGGFKTVTRVSGIKVCFKSSSLLTPTPGSGPITRHPHPHGLSLALTWKHEQREMSQVS